MADEEIKKLALQAGFELKRQPNGTLDLHPYVYEFARLLIKEVDKLHWEH